MAYKIKDIGLAEQGERQLSWAEMHMPALMAIRAEYAKKKSLKGTRIVAMLHVTKETGVLMRALKDAGASVALCGSNPLSTQDDVAAILAKEGIEVYAWKGESDDDYYKNMELALATKPDFLMDDGADLHGAAHAKHKDMKIIGGTEETTTGVIRIKAMEKDKVLRYPIVAVNNAFTKYLFDNRYGTGQSTVDGVIRATNIFIAGKTAVVAGYGWVGRGVAMRLHGFGAKVIITEVDPFKALEAVHDGFMVMKMIDAAPIGDIFITATGDKDVIVKEHMQKMKNGAILANTGHFDVEIDVAALRKMAKGSKQIRDSMKEYTLPNGNKLYVLVEGRLVNLGVAEGHPSEVMDLSFCNQFLSTVYVLENRKNLENKVYTIPLEMDKRIAMIKLESMNVSIDKLSPEQEKYMSQWESGT